jgi:hypothetical protein
VVQGSEQDLVGSPDVLRTRPQGVTLRIVSASGGAEDHRSIRAHWERRVEVSRAPTLRRRSERVREGASLFTKLVEQSYRRGVAQRPRGTSRALGTVLGTLSEDPASAPKPLVEGGPVLLNPVDEPLEELPTRARILERRMGDRG